MFSKIKSSLSNFNTYRFLNLLLLALLVYFIYSYFLKLDYVLKDPARDEPLYLADSLLLLEGIKPAMSHAPTGISTWLGSIVVLIDFIINNFKFNNLELLFENFDLTLFKHYKNLTYIKISLFALNTFLLIYLYILDKKKNFFSKFFSFIFITRSNSYYLCWKTLFFGFIIFYYFLIFK